MEFIGYIVGSTDRAVMFVDHFWEKADWMPKSQITIMREFDTDEVRIVASKWICGQKELKEFQYLDNSEAKEY